MDEGGLLAPHCRPTRDVEEAGSGAGMTVMRCGAGEHLLIFYPHVLPIAKSSHSMETVTMCSKARTDCVVAII